MNNFGSTLAKTVAFVGGAFAGTLLAGWLDKIIMARMQKNPEYDRTHYAQGLTPHSPPPSVGERRK